MPRPIYVAITIRASFEELWRRTQDPKLHERWDLRFTRIDYLHRESDAEPQRFTYETRLGFGLRIHGTGESTGEHAADGVSTSALKFASDDPKSLIREGSGYWKYARTEDGVRFLTLYDYRTRHGAIGAAVDRLVFRPLIGWATAWSFDRLRLWLERGIDPALSMQRSLANGVSRLILSLIWIYHGLVPKLILRHPDELEPIRAIGLLRNHAESLLTLTALLEIAFGTLLLILWSHRWLYLVSAIALCALAAGAAVTLPKLYFQPFNPLTLTVAMVGLCAIGWVSCRDLPSARNCLRRKPEGPA